MDSLIRSKSLQLFIISFITLFLELMFIRWIPSHVRLVAYYANLMLISSFLGIGVGALIRRYSLNLFRWFPLALVADIAFLISIKNTSLTAGGLEVRFFDQNPTITNTTVLVLVFILNANVFVGLGEKIGELFDSLPRLKAYAWDLGGSLLGSICFGLFSFLFFDPFWGFVLVAILYACILGRSINFASVVALGLTLFYVFVSTNPAAIWSPYHYITITTDDGGKAQIVADAPEGLRTMTDPPSFRVQVNQLFYQGHGTINPERFTPGTKKRSRVERSLKQFTIPYLVKPDASNVLVVGAGAGKDVEGALLNGAESVDAVEIDPALIRISKKFNSSGVYFDERVNVVNDDARAFFNDANGPYDLIAFSYLDSQSLFSSMSSIRLDGYVYTVESFRTAYDLLDEDGVLAISFYCPKLWLAQKLIEMAQDATGVTPYAYLRGSHLTRASSSSSSCPMTSSLACRLRAGWSGA